MTKICTDATTVAEALEIAGSFQAKDWWIERVLKVYDTFGPWIDEYAGAIPPLGAAAGIAHESKGDPLGTGDPDLGEAGLWSITTGVAENLDIDPLHPEAAIWAGAHLRNLRVKSILDNPFYVWLQDSAPFDWTKICWKLPGSLGMGGWKQLVGGIFGKGPIVGSERRRYPYAYMRDWMKTHGHTVEQMGKMTGPTIVCRAFRDHDVKWLESVDALHDPGAYEVIPRPEHLPHWDPKKFKKVVKTPAHLREERYPEYFATPTGRQELLRDLPRWQRNVVVTPPPVEDGLEPEEQVVDEDDLELLEQEKVRKPRRWPVVVGGVAVGLSMVGMTLAIAGGRR